MSPFPIEPGPARFQSVPMPDCPQCRYPLNTVRHHEGLFFVCAACNGRAVTFPQIRRVGGDRFMSSLLRQINRSAHLSDKPCPFCQGPMRVFQSAEPALELDACKHCGVVWFDPQEFETVPETVNESPEAAQMRGIETMAQQKMDRIREGEQAMSDNAPEEEWKTIPALFGFPVEAGAIRLSRHPWVTWSLVALIAFVSILAFFDLEAATNRFGLIPAEFLRLGGITLLTSFFLHGGICHLVGNLYFLWVFGDNVEEVLGRWRYVLLLLGASLAGDLVHIVMVPGSTIPCVGASGGISGIIVFYALQFPWARLGFLFRYLSYIRWVQIPAWMALLFWMVMQTAGVFMQLGGFSNVAATAHLGGAAAGFGFWLWHRWREN